MPVSPSMMWRFVLTRVARFSSYADAMRAYDSARLDGAISAVVDRIQHTPHGMHRHVLAELA
jgi:hypothetical protein